MNSQLYTLIALTNLHVGSGDSHYGIIDNLVQRDVLTKYPIIHSSSLKGALRQAFENTPGLGKTDNLRKLFGDEPRGEGKPGLEGSYAFSPPQLLSFPVRSDKVPFLNVTSPGLLQHLVDNQKHFDFGFAQRKDLTQFLTAVKAFYEKDQAIHGSKPIVFNLALNQAILERHQYKAIVAPNIQVTTLKPLLGEYIAVVSDAMLPKLCGENRLPVIARNNLENGISRNLWYEEVVPRQTRFWFWVHQKKKECEHDMIALATAFEKLIEKPVQIGANASIGYGFCEISRQS